MLSLGIQKQCLADSSVLSGLVCICVFFLGYTNVESKSALEHSGIYIIKNFLIHLLCIYETLLAFNFLCKVYKPKLSHKLTARFHFYI